MKNKFTVFFFFFLTILTYAQNNLIPDSSFGNQGVVEPIVGGDYSRTFSAIKLQPDGKLITYGPVVMSQTDGISPFHLARYKSDGTLDTSFGTNGLVQVGSGNSGMFNAQTYTNHVALLPDGKVLVVKMTDSQASSSTMFDIKLSRFNSNGTLDTTFGQNGEFVYPSVGIDYANCIAVQDDNKILICGYFEMELFVIRVNANGSLDTSFGNNGKYVGDFVPGAGRYNIASSIKLQNDGKILILGTDRANSGGDNICGLRLNTNGTLDDTFGQGGVFQYNSGYDDYFWTAQSVEDDGVVFFFARTCWAGSIDQYD